MVVMRNFAVRKREIVMTKGRRHILGALALLVLYLGYQVSVSAFAHVHMVHGVAMVHSHPSHDLEHHDHSDAQMISIALLSVIDSTEVSVLGVDDATPALLGVLRPVFSTFHFIHSHTHGITLRGPPAIL